MNTPAQNPMIRLMEAVRYAMLTADLTQRDVRELVEATISEISLARAKAS